MEISQTLALLNRGCREAGVCGEAVLETPGVKHARLMHRDDGKFPVLVALWSDGAITSCVLDEKGEQCCHTEAKGDEESFFAWVAHLSSPEVGYKEQSIEVES